MLQTENFLFVVAFCKVCLIENSKCLSGKINTMKKLAYFLSYLVLEPEKGWKKGVNYTVNIIILGVFKDFKFICHIIFVVNIYN